MNQVMVRKGVFGHVESELELYYQSRKDIIRLTNDFLLAGQSNLLGNYSALTKQRYLSEMQRFVRAIEHVFERLPPEKQEFIKLHYWSNPRPIDLKGITQQLNCSSRDLRQWQIKIVFDIAHELGWD